MAIKLIPKYQEGGNLRQRTATNPYQYLFNMSGGNTTQGTVDMGATLSTWKPPNGTMDPIKPISLGSSQANALTGLGSAPGANPLVNTKTLAVPKPGAGAGMSAGAVGAVAQGVADLGVAGIDAFSKDPGTDEFGNAKIESKGNTEAKSTLQGAGKGAATGALIGSVVPGLGTAVGAVAGGLIGGVSGFFKGKKDSEVGGDQYNKAHNSSYNKFYGNQYANQYQAMLGKDGMKMKTEHLVGKFENKDKLVPRLKKGGSINVIVSGKLHKENNSLGNKDKGIPVIDSKGRKEFELEKEELILNLEASKQVEKLVNNYNTKNEDNVLEELGKLVHHELLNNTKDNSKKFGLEV